MEKGYHLKLILNLLLPLVATVLCIILIPALIYYFLPFFIGWLISLIANPLVKFLDKRLKIVRKTGSAIVIVLVLAAVVLLLYAGTSAIINQAQKFSENIPSVSSGLQEEYENFSDELTKYYDKLPADMQDTISRVVKNVGDYMSNYMSRFPTGKVADTAGNYASNLPGIFVGIIVGILASYFFIAEKEELEEFLRHHTTKGQKKTWEMIRVQIFGVLGGYFKAQLKIMCVVYVILMVGLGLLHVSYFFLSALGIAFVDMLPFFGTGTILGPWAIIKFVNGDYKMAIALVALYAVTQVVRQLIQPKLLGDSMGMNPFATLFFMYLGFKIYSVLGMILAVPVAMIIYRLYEAGAFDVMIFSAKQLYREARKFMHIDLPQKRLVDQSHGLKEEKKTKK